MKVRIGRRRIYFGPNSVSQWPSGSVNVEAQDPGVTSRGSLINVQPRSNKCCLDAVTLSAATTISIAPANG